MVLIKNACSAHCICGCFLNKKTWSVSHVFLQTGAIITSMDFLFLLLF